mmetsp:Transcript_3940/g.5686  ORF Transcript_3940/g.5686 Transcript_3940/m.5686 type:complete len:102 (-) Transcript_3940:760-1065(-)
MHVLVSLLSLFSAAFPKSPAAVVIKQSVAILAVVASLFPLEVGAAFGVAEDFVAVAEKSSASLVAALISYFDPETVTAGFVAVTADAFAVAVVGPLVAEEE